MLNLGKGIRMRPNFGWPLNGYILVRFKPV